ncbi:hypothetical protein [Bacillus sp. FJAT-22090]|nr:hypothetical protein [Bacillus sp. FJAT-22090]
MNLIVTTDEHRIYFRNEEVGFMGYTSYDADLIEKLQSVNWYVRKRH